MDECGIEFVIGILHLGKGISRLNSKGVLLPPIP
jgi:hypothetical protein